MEQANRKRGQGMNQCDICEEMGMNDCMHCYLGNPCWGCDDYIEMGECKSNGGCGQKQHDEGVTE